MKSWMVGSMLLRVTRSSQLNGGSVGLILQSGIIHLKTILNISVLNIDLMMTNQNKF